MSEILPVRTSSADYQVHIGPELIQQVGPLSRELCKGKHCAVITDENVAPLYLEQLLASLYASGWTAVPITVPAGEKSKSLHQVELCCEKMIAAGLDRKALLFALGGGVVGDLVGFVASIYFRGIPFIQVPTSVVAQVDSSVGGKTGVNSRLGKNLIGVFQQPLAVIADTDTLQTLPPREFCEGLAEVIKHAIIRDRPLLDLIKTTPNENTPALIARNVRIKANIVEEDEKETSGTRALLNFGHTVGHAIENAAGYGHFLHGEAISLGILAALDLSAKHAGLPQSEVSLIREKLAALDLPTKLPAELSDAAILSAMKTDKKFQEGKIHFVLTEKLGTAFVSDKVTLDDIQESLGHLRPKNTQYSQ
ncbi:MAG: 3-dehydroquinate synthase [Chthoniobacterales bacterium]